MPPWQFAPRGERQRGAVERLSRSALAVSELVAQAWARCMCARGAAAGSCGAPLRAVTRAALSGTPDQRAPRAARNWCAIGRSWPVLSVRIARTCTPTVRVVSALASDRSSPSSLFIQAATSWRPPRARRRPPRPRAPPNGLWAIVRAPLGAEPAPYGACRGRAGRGGRGCCRCRAGANSVTLQPDRDCPEQPLPSSDQQQQLCSIF